MVSYIFEEESNVHMFSQTTQKTAVSGFILQLKREYVNFESVFNFIKILYFFSRHKEYTRVLTAPLMGL